MAMDEDNDDGLGGRSRTRREITEANRWGRALCELTDVQFAGAPLPPEIREAVALGRTITSFRARDRQWYRIDKLVRDLDDEVVAVIDRYLAAPDARLDALRRWADRLVAGGDDVLGAWLIHRPRSDRQHLRTLIRNARTGTDAARARAVNHLVDALTAADDAAISDPEAEA